MKKIGVKKKLCRALDSFKKALPIMITFKNKENTLAAYYYLGLAYAGSG
jgi:hypothetical protein